LKRYVDIETVFPDTAHCIYSKAEQVYVHIHIIYSIFPYKNRTLLPLQNNIIWCMVLGTFLGAKIICHLNYFEKASCIINKRFSFSGYTQPSKVQLEHDVGIYAGMF
jgi:hypothetical protein